MLSSASSTQAYFILRFPILRWVSTLLFIGILQGIAAGVGTSNFLRAAVIVSLNFSSFGSIKNIPLNCLASSTFVSQVSFHLPPVFLPMPDQPSFHQVSKFSKVVTVSRFAASTLACALRNCTNVHRLRSRIRHLPGKSMSSYNRCSCASDLDCFGPGVVSFFQPLAFTTRCHVSPTTQFCHSRSGKSAISLRRSREIEPHLRCRKRSASHLPVPSLHH